GANLGDFEPALRRDAASLGVDAQHDLVRKLPAHLFKPRRRLQRFGADDDARHAPRQRLGDMFFGAQAAAELTRDAAGLNYGADASFVDGLPGLGAVQIDDVEVSSPIRDPAPRHGAGIGAEHGFLLVIALSQPHALAAAQVDGGVDLHGVTYPPLPPGEGLGVR